MAAMAEISVGLQSLKTAFEIGKTILGLKISSEVAERVGDMNQRIFAAQQSALASQEHQSTLLKTISDLEAQIAELEAWDTEAETYELVDIAKPVPAGFIQKRIFVYAPKAGTHASEAPHILCERCFNKRHKSILHTVEPDIRVEAIFCQECRSLLYLTTYQPDLIQPSKRAR